jgi:hypothetical protein
MVIGTPVLLRANIWLWKKAVIKRGYVAKNIKMFNNKKKTILLNFATEITVYIKQQRVQNKTFKNTRQRIEGRRSNLRRKNNTVCWLSNYKTG